MSVFRQMPDEVYREAGEVIRAVSGRGERPEVEVMPGFERMVAGVAVALGKAAPNAIYDASRSESADWVKEGSQEWRHLHAATAHAIDSYRRVESIVSPDAGPVMTHIVSDVLLQTAARRMDLAVRNSHPSFSASLDEAQRARVEEARLDTDEARTLHAESYGAFSDLSRWKQVDRVDVMKSGENLSPQMKQEIALIAGMVDREVMEVGPRVRRIDERLADFMEPEEPKPLFQPVTVLETDAVKRIVDGVEAPQSKAEAAIAAHVEIVGLREDEPANFARAQALADHEARTPGGGLVVSAERPSEIAVRIEAHRLAIEDARRRAFEEEGWPDPLPEHVEQVAFGRRTDIFSPEVQVGLFQAIENGDRVPGLVTMQLGMRAEAVFEEGLAAAMGRSMTPAVTYENITAEAAKDFMLNDLHLPGDKVRFDDRVNIRGVDKDALRTELGTEPLEVARTIVVGTTHENGLGGTSPAVRPEYEFVGHKGRFPAGQFQHERGDEHVYGVVASVGDRMFLVPMDDKVDFDQAKATGPAREIVATLRTRDADRNAETMSNMREDTAQAPVAGEFAFRPMAFSRREGPVELVAVPWMSGASEAEVVAARAAIDVEIGAPSVSLAVHAASQARDRGMER